MESTFYERREENFSKEQATDVAKKLLENQEFLKKGLGDAKFDLSYLDAHIMCTYEYTNSTVMRNRINADCLFMLAIKAKKGKLLFDYLVELPPVDELASCIWDMYEYSNELGGGHRDIFAV